MKERMVKRCGLRDVRLVGELENGIVRVPDKAK